MKSLKVRLSLVEELEGHHPCKSANIERSESSLARQRTLRARWLELMWGAELQQAVFLRPGEAVPQGCEKTTLLVLRSNFYS